MLALATPSVDSLAVSSPEFRASIGTNAIVCPRLLSSLAISSMELAEDIEVFSSGAELAMDPAHLRRLRELDIKSEGKIFLGNSYGQDIAEGLLEFADHNYRQSNDATQRWLDCRERMAASRDFDGGVLKIVLGGMTQVFRRTVSETRKTDVRFGVSVNVLAELYPHSQNVRSIQAKHLLR